uniref:Uncharacterized protein n=1 Tax=Calcidiscus leptoporus TaxID=127549 RepID=A0A7S0IXH3_9EUKA
MTSRLNTLAATQRALLEKIQALDKQEAEEEAAIEELDEEDEAGREMAPADNEEDVLAMLMSKQRELQKMRSAITELQQLQSGVQDLLSGRPQPPQATASAPAEVGSDQYEQDFLEGLLRKRNELQRMQEALAGLTGSGGALEAQELEDIEEDFEEDFEEDEDDEAPTTQPAPAATTNELQAKEEMLAMLTAKHAELTRMRASIMELQQLQADEQAAALDDDDEEEEKDEEEPQTEQEWIAKLVRQQAELRQLHAAIATAEGTSGVPAAAEEVEVEADDDDDDDDDEEAQAMLQALAHKREELQSLLFAKASLEKQLDDERKSGAATASKALPKAPPPAPPPAELKSEENELGLILERRKAAQRAVDEQERKIAELTELQETLRSRLEMMEHQGVGADDGEAEAAQAAAADEEAEEEEEADDDEGEPPSAAIQERVMRLLKVKTQQCDQLAEFVEKGRASGIDLDDERLLRAEQELAQRYAEVKDIAAIARRLGVSSFAPEEPDDDAEEQEEEEEEQEETALYDMPPAAQKALARVEHLEGELRSCLHALAQVEAASAPNVTRHPAYVQMRADVQQQLEGLNGELEQAREVYEYEMSVAAAQREAQPEVGEEDGLAAEEEELDLAPMLQATINKLWARPYECRIFALQLLKSLAELDDRSLSMMCSCFAKYLDEHAVPVP